MCAKLLGMWAASRCVLAGERMRAHVRSEARAHAWPEERLKCQGFDWIKCTTGRRGAHARAYDIGVVFSTFSVRCNRARNYAQFD